LDQAAEQARASLEEAIATGYELLVCQALRIAVCPVALITGDLAAAERDIARLADIAHRFNTSLYKSVARCFEGRLLIERGALEAGLALLRSELDAYERTGWTSWYPEFLSVFAEGLAGLGRITEAIAAVNKALDTADGGERYYVAELLRIKGECQLDEAGDPSNAAAEDCFQGALEVARQQGALFWELRTAVSLARLKVRQNQPNDARRILAPVYDRFTEGFETVDLRFAREILKALPASG
jgi:predicted ATPase